LSSAYHNNREIGVELDSLRRRYPDWIAVDTIGFSALHRQPILLAKLSDNPRQVESEPAVLFIGQMHAEEVLGVEVALELMKRLLEGLDYDTARARLQEVEVYIIPTINPDGSDVVHQGLDLTFRKNCRDNIGDGVFRYTAGVGLDTSGVDLNRNFDLHWNRGDSLYQVREGESYNYYRGASPFSEPEARALGDLMLDRRFLFCITYHSSRSGQNAEMVIAPWNWESRRPPDSPALDAVGSALAGRLPRQMGGGNYSLVRATQRVGQLPDWAYQATGALTYMVEVGAVIQPDSITMQQVVASALPSAMFLIDLSCGRERIGEFGFLTIMTIDRMHNRPVSMEVLLNSEREPVLEPRLSHPATGRFDALLPNGSYSLALLQNGCMPFERDQIEVISGERRTIVADITTIPATSVRFRVITAGDSSMLPAAIRLYASDNRTRYNLALPQGQIEYNLPFDIYRLEATSPNYLPVVETFELNRDNWTFNMQPAEIVYDENFTNDLNWQRGGWGERWGIETVDGRTCLTESLAGDYVYSTVVWLLLETGIEYRAEYDYSLQMIHRPYFEPGMDFATVEFYAHRMREWLPAAMFSQFPHGWDTLFISLRDYDLAGGPICIRLKITTDEEVNEDGWLIDRMILYRTILPRSVEPYKVLKPNEITLSVFPNPANGTLKILFKSASALSVNLRLLDSRGRIVYELSRGDIPSGAQSFSIDSRSLPSGLYYTRFEGNNMALSKPMLILR